MVKLVRKWLHFAIGHFFESRETESIGQGQKLTHFSKQSPKYFSENGCDDIPSPRSAICCQQGETESIWHGPKMTNFANVPRKNIECRPVEGHRSATEEDWRRRRYRTSSAATGNFFLLGCCKLFQRGHEIKRKRQRKRIENKQTHKQEGKTE